jgi:IS1 family transposase/transposase-like protein
VFCGKCGEECAKHGKTRDGQQRWRCRPCKVTVSEPKPLAHSGTDLDDACRALSMLLEGMSVRSVMRLTGLDKATILRLVVKAGKQCQAFFDATIKDVWADDVQCDEQWSFIAMKERTAEMLNADPCFGDSYVFTAVDRDTKLLLCYHVGKRCPEDTNRFARKLSSVVKGRTSVSTDGYTPYKTAIPAAFANGVDHGMVIKQFGNAEPNSGRSRYSPPAVIGVTYYQNAGNPDMDRVCTSHVERMNLSNRMHLRRFTRLTNAFSKKLENHVAMFALYAAWFNFCRKHQTLKTTPAVAAGKASEPWTLAKLLQASAAVVGTR